MRCSGLDDTDGLLGIGGGGGGSSSSPGRRSEAAEFSTASFLPSQGLEFLQHANHGAEFDYDPHDDAAEEAGSAEEGATRGRRRGEQGAGRGGRELNRHEHPSLVYYRNITRDVLKRNYDI